MLQFSIKKMVHLDFIGTLEEKTLKNKVKGIDFCHHISPFIQVIR